MSNQHLKKALLNPNDEYYTRYQDIVKELTHFENCFRGRSVFCPCDDSFSQFRRFFTENFERLSLTKLTCLGLEGFCYEFDGRTTTITKMDGDFRSSDSRCLLNDCNIVCTNPPFSLWSEFYRQLIQSKKDYLVVGSKLCVQQKVVFLEFKNKKCTTGFTMPTKFDTPAGTQQSRAAQWYTSLPTLGKRQWEATASIADVQYEKFDAYPAINVNAVELIPKDYPDWIAVPLTAVNGFNYTDFELVDCIGRKAIVNEQYNVKGKQLTEVKGIPCASRLILRKLNLNNERSLPIEKK